MDGLPPSGQTSARALRWRLLLARIEAALVSPANAVLIGLSGIAAVTCLVAEARGLLNPGTWAVAAGAGAVVLAGKVALDLRDRAGDDGLWRALLARGFGDTMADDAEVTRLARTVIEYRVRLAMAEARAARASRRALQPLLPRLDDWLEGIMRLARQVATLRRESRFHVAMGARNRRRLSELGSGAGLDAQVRAAEGFGREADDGLVRLENAVAAFGAATSQLVLDMARAQGLDGSAVTDARIGGAIQSVATETKALSPPPEPP
ncbi:MAG: hypothetical protein ACT4OK_11450 [Gemmobacter sp.]